MNTPLILIWIFMSIQTILILTCIHLRWATQNVVKCAYNNEQHRHLDKLLHEIMYHIVEPSRVKEEKYKGLS